MGLLSGQNAGSFKWLGDFPESDVTVLVGQEPVQLYGTSTDFEKILHTKSFQILSLVIM